MSKMNLTQTHKKIIVMLSIIVFILLSIMIFWYVGKPLIKFLEEPDKFREWVDSHGILAHIAFIAITVLQVIIAIIPGEPLEIAAGYAFGVIEGTVLCMIGILIGSIIVFCFVRYFGIKAVEVFFSREKINSLKFLKNTKKLTYIVYIIFLIPGTPKDLISYFIGLTNMKLSTWIVISTVGRIPSIITSTVGGNALGVQDYQFAIIVFVVTFLISGAGLLIYNKITKVREGSVNNEEG